MVTTNKKRGMEERRLENVPLLRLSGELQKIISDSSSIVTSFTVVPSKYAESDLGQIQINRRNVLQNTLNSEKLTLETATKTARCGGQTNFSKVWSTSEIFESKKLGNDEHLDLVENASQWCSTVQGNSYISFILTS